MEAPIATETQPTRKPARSKLTAQTSEAKHAALQAARFALEKKAEDIKVFDLRKLTSITDFFVICTGSTDTQVRAIADHIADQFAEEGNKPWHIEGLERSQWILLDYVNFVVHVFDPKTREYYGLERLWGDADFQEVRDELGD